MNPGGSLFLVGMMAAGKSTVGRLVAKATGLRFIDADTELEARVGCRIRAIFEREGEAGFRTREAALIDELTRLPGIVLSTGGGAVLASPNREALRNRGFVVYIETSADEILRRTRNDRDRPLLQVADPRAQIVALLAQREPLYRATAHRSFRSLTANPRRLVERILADPDLRGALGLPTAGPAPGG